MNLLRQYLNVFVILLMGVGAVCGIEESVEFIDVNQKKALFYFHFVTMSMGIRFFVEFIVAGVKSFHGLMPELLVTGGGLIFAYEARRASALRRTFFYVLAIGFVIAEYRML